MTGSTSSKSRPDSKTGWRKRNDQGPHTATFPSGARLRFVIPDSGTLLRSGRLPERLKTTALLCAAHPEGPDGLMADLVMQSVIAGEKGEFVTQAINDGMELGYALVAEMLVEPEVTAEEVAGGEFPELDIRMLLEFAERKRNVDAAGNQLPIVLLGKWATFRGQQAGPDGSGNGGAGGEAVVGDVPGADEEPV